MAERFVRIEEAVGSNPIISTPVHRCRTSVLANFAMVATMGDVATMNVSIPDDLKSFVETQVATEGYGTSSEYVRALIRRDLARQSLRALLLDGLESKVVGVADATFFARLRRRRRKQR